ncbi:hypothetical protein [Embleya sp. NBC_00896]|nr:hypothetical protein OG928_34205 [Embleya sp. NBC_00896]
MTPKRHDTSSLRQELPHTEDGTRHKLRRNGYATATDAREDLAPPRSR